MNLLETLLGPDGTESVRAVSTMIAGIEHDLHEAVTAHYEALGIEPPEEGPPVEARAEQLDRLVHDYVSGDLWGYFVDEQAPEALRNPDDARAFAGQEDKEWQDSLEALAERAPDDHGGSTRERAGAVIEAQFGLDVDTFESRIVEWTPERTLQRALRGRIDADIERIQLATEAIERSGD